MKRISKHSFAIVFIAILTVSIISTLCIASARRSAMEVTKLR